MNELIQVAERQIGGGTIQTVNARDLHAFLGSKRQFADWISERIQKYGFVENQDFVIFSQNCEKPKGGRPAKEFALTLDMAKELAMVENNDKGKQVGCNYTDDGQRRRWDALRQAREAGVGV